MDITLLNGKKSADETYLRLLSIVLSPESPIYDLSVPSRQIQRNKTISNTFLKQKSDLGVGKQKTYLDAESLSVPKSPKESSGANRHFGIEGYAAEPIKSLSTESLINVREGDGQRHGYEKPAHEDSHAGRVASWAVSFEHLMQDADGVMAFTEYLKKEHSEENMQFWSECEKYKAIRPLQQRREKASEIFYSYLSEEATEPVNVDSYALKISQEDLDLAHPNIFDEAQHQVFMLMKTDSYSRFIKSEAYQSQLITAMQCVQPYPARVKPSKPSVSSDASDTETHPQKRRTLKNIVRDFSRSITNSRNSQKDDTVNISKASSRSSDDSSVERSRAYVGRSRVLDHSLTVDLSDIKHTLDSSSGEDMDDEKLLRINFPDGSTTVCKAKRSDSLQNVVGLLLGKKPDLSVAALEVFPRDSAQVLDMALKVADLHCQELRLEKRVLFRVDFSNKKAVAVRARHERTLREVLKPVLNKYGFNPEHSVITLGPDTVSLDVQISSLENKRLTVTHKDQFQEWGVSIRKSQSLGSSLLHGCDGIFDYENPISTETPAKKSKGGQLLALLKTPSEATLKKSKVKVVTFAPTKSMAESHQTRGSDESFLEIITKAQSSRFDDQRGVGVNVGDLPDFLKSNLDEPPPSASNTRSNKDGAQSNPTNINSALYNQASQLKATPNKVSVDQNYNSLNKIAFDFDQPSSDLNSTLTPANQSMDDTLTTEVQPQSPFLSSVPPPPQFGNDAYTSTPQRPPPYKEAISHSSLAFTFYSNDSNNQKISDYKDSSKNSINTIPGNNPRNRLSLAHHQPLIVIDDDNRSVEGRDHLTPSPSTHDLLLTSDEQFKENSNSSNKSYNFYEVLSKNKQQQPLRRAEPVRVTFV